MQRLLLFQMSLRSLATVSVLCIGIGNCGTAQAQSLAPGTRVRIAHGDSLTAGHVFRSTPDSLSIARDRGGHTRLLWSEVDRLEYSAGTRGNAGRGAVIGAGIMTLLAIGIVVFDGNDDQNQSGFRDDTEWGAEILIIAIPLYAAIGAGIGSIIGFAVRTEQWHALPLRVSSGSGHYDIGISVAIRL